MKIELDTEVDALYIELRAGEVGRTLDLDEGVFLDLDAEGRVLGLEFISTKAFEHFLRRNGGVINIPDKVESRESLGLSPA